MVNTLFARAATLAMAAALLALVGAAAYATAAGAPTPGACGDTCTTPWSAPQRSIVRLANGCAVRITWIARPSCDVGWDVSVLRVEPLDDACGGLSPRRLVDEATDSLIASRETGFFTMAGSRDTCVVIGRLLRAACWGVRTECADSVVVPCDSTSCCESQVLLCTDVIFRRRIVRGGSTLRSPCDPRRACTSICSAPVDTLDRPPVDTIGTDPDDVDALSQRRRDVGGDRLKPRRPAWLWRDPRPVRTPVREVRDDDWMMAGAARRAGTLDD